MYQKSAEFIYLARKPEITNKTRQFFKTLIVATYFDSHDGIFVLYNDVCNIVRNIFNDWKEYVVRHNYVS